MSENQNPKTVRPSLKNPAWTPGTPREIFVSEAVHVGDETGCTAKAALAAVVLDPTTQPEVLAWWMAATAKQQTLAYKEILRGLRSRDGNKGRWGKPR